MIIFVWYCGSLSIIGCLPRIATFIRDVWYTLIGMVATLEFVESICYDCPRSQHGRHFRAFDLGIL
jgi:hypothetical protein